ncbi:MAG: metallophosphoesterase [Candidatus Alcyoniella australis]|nr:metallophosphoesterase [Candidatus Alcyoniella australis]
MKKTIVLSLLILSALVGSAQAAEFTISPFVTNVTRTSIDICFQSESNQLAAINFGPTADYGSEIFVSGELLDATWGHYLLFGAVTWYDLVQRYAYCTTIENLEPDSLYHYAVTLGDASSADSTFASAPDPDQPFRFVVYGDSRSDPLYPLGETNQFHQGVIERMAQYDFDFMFNVGDIVNDGHDMQLWQIALATSAPVAARSAYYPIYGNHEDREEEGIDGKDVYSAIFSNPGEQSLSGNEFYYSFNYSNAHFVVVSTEHGFQPGDAQYQWIADDLEETALNPDITWKFMLFHIPAFTSSFRWPTDNTEHQAQEFIVPLAEEYELDMVLMGHEHSYERSYKDGIYWMVAGNGGALPTFFGNPAHNPYSQFFEPNGDFEHFGFCLIEINGDYLKLESIISDGTIIDTLEIGDPPEPDPDDDDDDDIDDDDVDDDDDINADDDDDDDNGCCG